MHRLHRRITPGIATAIGCLVVAGGAAAATVPRLTGTSDATSTASPVQVTLTDAQGRQVGVATLTPAPAAGATPASASGPPAAGTPTPTGSASPAGTSGPPSASASPTLTVPGGGTPVAVHLEISALPAGSHGFDIDATGRCDGPAFASAGPVFNPAGGVIGALDPAARPAGELPNLPVGSDGRATVDFVTSQITLDPGLPASLQRPQGTSLVVHARSDDGRTAPEGGAGARIACGVIVPDTTGGPSAGGAGRAPARHAARTAAPPTATPAISGTGTTATAAPSPTATPTVTPSPASSSTSTSTTTTAPAPSPTVSPTS